MKLISMTDYVLESMGKFNTYESEENLKQIINYVNFLKQPLELGMFIPCDENDVPLCEPKIICKSRIKWDDLLNRYKNAKESILFKGFEILSSKDYVWVLKYTSRCQGLFLKEVEYNILKDQCIEDLIDLDLQLTDSAIKKYKL